MSDNKLRFLGRGILFGIGALVFASVIALLFGWVLMLLWNWLMPVIFNLPLITYWQSWGLILLSHLLFKGHGNSGHPSPGSRSYGSNSHDEHFSDFRNKFHKKWQDNWHAQKEEEGIENE